MGRKQRAARGQEGDAFALRHGLVQRLKATGLLPDPRVEAAFRAVPRHLFLPETPLATAYTDEAIATKKQDGIPISSSSQPAVMAIMLQQLDLKPGHRVLEIGAGTGYNAALMAHLVGRTGGVTTVDIDQDIVDSARSHLASADCNGVRVVCGDGALGYPDSAPYDRIILTVGAWDIAPAWIEQLAPSGRLVLPLALNGTVQKLVAFERRDGHLESVSVRDGSFMPLRGTLAGPPVHQRLGPDPDCVLSLGAPRSVDSLGVYALLTGPHRDLPTSLHVTQDDIWSGIGLWLALHAPSMCGIMAQGEAATRGIVPGAFGASRAYLATAGLLEDSGLCLLASTPAESSDTTISTLGIWSYGPEDEPAQHLLDLLLEWDRAGRPSSAGLRIRTFPRDAVPPAEDGGARIDKPQTQLVLDWP